MCTAMTIDNINAFTLKLDWFLYFWVKGCVSAAFNSSDYNLLAFPHFYTLYTFSAGKIRHHIWLEIQRNFPKWATHNRLRFCEAKIKDCLIGKNSANNYLQAIPRYRTKSPEAFLRCNFNRNYLIFSAVLIFSMHCFQCKVQTYSLQSLSKLRMSSSCTWDISKCLLSQ